ncbi:MAG: replication factor A [Methanosarcinaceae archaeon]|nr:replication factor A [Methanosarcinaceae archaeon]
MPTKEIEVRLDTLVTKFKVPLDEARRSVVNYYLKEHNIARNEFYTGQSESPLLSISHISQDGRWITVKGKVAQLWDNSHETISQVGLIGDKTGTIKFTKWTSAELPDVEEDKNYLFKNVVVTEWGGKFQINLNKNSTIEEIDEEIEIGSSSVSFTGAMVDIQSGSGLIKRCPTCNRALTKGACTDHGKVDGVYDLRIKAVLDNGTTTQEALLKRELTEKISGMTLDGAIALAADALDQGVVLDHIKNGMVGRYYTVTGPRLDRYILVESIELQSNPDAALLEELITAAEVA